MKSFAQFITEGRDAPLFHATDVSGASNIVRTDVIEARTFQRTDYSGPGAWSNKNEPAAYREYSGVSLSRSRKYATRYAFHEKNFNTVIIFELDQRKLAQTHKIIPYNYYGAGLNQYNQGKARIQNPWEHHMNEQEEYVIGAIKNLNRYILKLHVMSELTMETLNSKAYYKTLRDHPLLWDSTNATKEGTWINQ